MGWDERLFGWAWKRGRALLGRKPPGAGHPEVLLDPLKDRLRVLALAVGGPGLVLRAAEAEGGVSRNVILLPSKLDTCSDPAQTERLYVARTTLAATVVLVDP